MLIYEGAKYYLGFRGNKILTIKLVSSFYDSVVNNRTNKPYIRFTNSII